MVTMTSNSNDDTRQAFIIGVDFGTTYSGVAYCYTGDPTNIRTIKSWPGNNRCLEKVPSVIQYGPRDLSRYKWGFDVPPDAPNPLRWFKLLLNEQNPGTMSGRARAMPQRLSETHNGDAEQLSLLLSTISYLPQDKTPLTVVTDYLRGVYQHTRNTLPYPPSFTSRIGIDIDLEFCLTVPAIWNDAAKDLTLQAARAAGMSESHVTIKTVSEPEAAAVHCLNAFSQSDDCLKVGDVYVIADCGGGTVDLISYEITSVEPRLRVDECVGGTGGLCGSTALNRRFELLVKERLGTEEWQNMSTVARFNTMLYFDEFLKPSFCPQESADEEDDEFEIETDTFHCPVPGVAADPGRGIHGGHLLLTTEEMKKLFEPTFVEITELVQQQISSAEAKNHAPVTAVLLVGGFGSSRYLFKYLSTNLKAMDGNPVKILQPQDAWSAIARGAVSYGLTARDVRTGRQPSGSGPVGSRIARFSYGLAASESFIPGLHPSTKMYFDAITGSFWCRGRMQWFVNKDQRIEDGKENELPSLARTCPTDAEGDQLVFRVGIYSCDSARPPLDVEDTDVRHLLTYNVDLNDVSREFFIRKKAVLGNGDYYHIPLGMVMKLESGCLEFSTTVGGKTMGKGSADYDHEAPQETS